MALSLSRWRPTHLLLSWIGYWAALAVATLSAPALAIWRATQSGPGKGTVNAGFENAALHLTVIRDGVTTWTGTSHLGTIALAVAGPPLLLWLAWVATRPRGEARLSVPDAPRALGAPMFDPEPGVRSREPRSGVPRQ